jgi:hypothetical protein
VTQSVIYLLAQQELIWILTQNLTYLLANLAMNKATNPVKHAVLPVIAWNARKDIRSLIVRRRKRFVRNLPKGI